MSEEQSAHAVQNTCGCCSQPIADDAELCPACKAQLDLTVIEPFVRDEDAEQKQGGRTPLVDLAQLPNAFTTDNGFSYPNWESVDEFIDREVAEPDRVRAGQDAVLQWFERLRSDLDGSYVVRESGRFVLLSCVTDRYASLVFAFGEQTLAAIDMELGEAAWMMGAGQYPIVIFNDDENYRRYIRHFHPRDRPEGMVADTSGSCLGGGYAHVALPPRALWETKCMLAHELTHATTAHLLLPRWVSEGLAMTIERTIVGEPPLSVSDQLRSDLRAFWNEKNIQSFWSGESFIVPDLSNELSYTFAEILFRYVLKTSMLKSGKDPIGFLKAADYEDAGQSAALNFLDMDLNDAVVEFLGPGEWRPNRIAIAEFWQAVRWEKSEAVPPTERAS